MLEWVIVLGITVVGIGAHELTHAAACYYYGARWRPMVHWTGRMPNPAIGTELRDHTPRTLRAVSLAPLVMFVPAAVMIAVIGPKTVVFGDGLVESALFMWCLCSFPSLTDWRNAKRADDLEAMHAVWYGDHPVHRLVEGIPK